MFNILFALAMMNPSLAQDGTGVLLEAPVGAEPLEERIRVVPEGSFVLLPNPEGAFVPRRVPSKFWLLPDSHYTEALARSKQLDIVAPALERCTERSLQWQDRTYEALESCSQQFGKDEALVAQLTSDVKVWETRALLAEDKVQRSRRTTMVAWAITGGLVFGGIVATSVSWGM